MRYLLSLMVLFLFNTGQSQILLLMEDGIAGADTIPSQFTFADVTDAAVSSYNQGYIVVAGCDSARFYTNGTDSLKLGALGTYDVSEIWADVGDTVYMGNVASASNSTTTNKVLYSSNGTPLDTFSVTTVAGGDTLGSDLAPNGGSELAYTGSNGWSGAFGGTITRSTGEQVRTGTYSAKGETVGSGTGIQFQIPGTATPTETYWVEGYIYISTSGGQVKATTDEGEVIISTTGSWTYFKYSFVAGDVSPYVNFTENGATSPVTFYVDDVTVKRRLP